MPTLGNDSNSSVTLSHLFTLGTSAWPPPAMSSVEQYFAPTELLSVVSTSMGAQLPRLSFCRCPAFRGPAVAAVGVLSREDVSVRRMVNGCLFQLDGCFCLEVGRGYLIQ